MNTTTPLRIAITLLAMLATLVATGSHAGADGTAPPPPQEPSTYCSPHYLVCVPTNIGDVDCDRFAAPFARVGDDPYDLDSDGDGIACEHLAADEPAAAAAPAASHQPALAVTGNESTALVVVGATMLAAGAMVLQTARRRSV